MTKIPPELLRFSVVGTVGFIVDAGLLHLLHGSLGADLYTGRAISFLVAMTATWMLNRSFTFRNAAKRGAGRQWSAYAAVSLFGASMNYGTYAALVATQSLVAAFPMLGVACGSIAGLTVNFLGAKYLVFRPEPAEANI